MNGRISVIVPIYNVSEYLDQCITSIMRQTYSDLQIILVDDGSIDGSLAICRRYQKRDDRIIVIHQENQGLVGARKSGVKAAVGEFVAYVDGDDWIEPRMYEHLIGLASEYDADIVLGGSIEDVGGQTIRKTNRLDPGAYDKERLHKEVYPYMLCDKKSCSMGIQPYIWNKLMRRDLALECVMAVDDRIRIGEDVAAVMPMLFKANKVVISDYCDYHYCIRGTSMMMRQENEEKEWDELCILHKFLQDKFSLYHNQLAHYTIMNMLTRTYEKIAMRYKERGLWPFDYKIRPGKCIIYGAGNFGRAVYGYLKDKRQMRVEWVDQEFRKYQLLGLPVRSVEEIAKEQEADFLVAILDMHLAEVIKEDLWHLGIHRERIYCTNITDDVIQEILKCM